MILASPVHIRSGTCRSAHPLAREGLRTSWAASVSGAEEMSKRGGGLRSIGQRGRSSGRLRCRFLGKTRLPRGGFFGVTFAGLGLIPRPVQRRELAHTLRSLPLDDFRRGG